MTKTGAPKKFTRLGYPDSSQEQEDLSAMGIENVGGAYGPSDIVRPQFDRFWMLTGEEPSGNYETGFTITTADNPTGVILGAAEVWDPSFERGGFIEGSFFGKWTNTSAGDVITLKLQVNDIATSTNKILDHTANAGSAITFVDVFSAATASIVNHADPGYVDLRFRFYSEGKTAQGYVVESRILRGGTFTGPTLIGMGETAINHEFDSGCRLYRVVASVAHASTTWLVRSSCGFQHGIRYGH
ncbi:MAG TPA: hypothetical protein VEJ18_20665 [Planctomycetota bacterium]|nr:hypothetical protein [Planctomycetota bacterium]